MSRTALAAVLRKGGYVIFRNRLREYHGELAAGPASRSILHHDLNVPAKARQAVNQFAFGNPPELPAEKGGDPGLGQAENPGHLDLGQHLAADDFRDLRNQLCLDQHLLGAVVAEVGVHIAAAFVDYDAFNDFGFSFDRMGSWSPAHYT